jgi:hypothetical protein
MRSLKYALFAAVAVVMLSFAPQKAEAQVSFGVNIGAVPACPYGYYGYAPYNCAPYGYYGPEWFNSGIFLGAGPWYHGSGFYGHVNRSFDPRYGYHGAYPNRGEAYHEPADHFQNFHASHYSDPHGSYHTEAQHGHYTNQHH